MEFSYIGVCTPTRLLLEDQKNHILTEARSEVTHQEREREALHRIGGKRKRALQETRMRNLQKMEELNKFCCTEAERPQQLRADELSRQEKENKSTMNQLTVQIQEL